jgi:hypothetical protein
MGENEGIYTSQEISCCCAHGNCAASSLDKHTSSSQPLLPPGRTARLKVTQKTFSKVITAFEMFGSTEPTYNLIWPNWIKINVLCLLGITDRKKMRLEFPNYSGVC